MVKRSIKAITVSSVALFGLTGPVPASAQFGVGANRRKGAASSFEELNKMAAERMDAEKAVSAGGGFDLEGMDLGALMGDIDADTLQKIVQEGMKDPELQQMFSGMQGAMEELMNMDSEQLKTQMAEAMSMLTSADMQNNLIEQKDDVLAMMEAQGAATPEEIAEFRANPEKFETEMTKAFGQMKEVFQDPKAFESLVEMMAGFKEIMNDPDAAMSKLGEVLQDALADDEKIEEARLQLLNDPSVAGNQAMSDMFDSEEMKDILKDPKKWKKSVKEGQKMLIGDTKNKVGGVGMGEL